MGYTGPTQSPVPDGEAAFWQYGYVPSLALGIVGVVTFLAISGGQLWWFVKKRSTRSVHGLFFFACVCEALGYGARLHAHNRPFAGMSFLLGISLIQVATVLITAAFYKALQRGLKYMPNGESLTPMRIRSLLTVFIILDVVWVMMQIAGQYFWAAAEGAELTDDDEPMFALGTSALIFLAGNVLQGISQAITIIINSVFCLVIYRRSTKVINVADPGTGPAHIQPLMAQIIISFGLFFVRLLMRIAEGAQGAYESALNHEVYFGVLEYAPIFLIIALWAVRPLHKFIFPFGHPRTHATTHAAEQGIASSYSAGESDYATKA